MEQNTTDALMKAPTLAPDACRDYMSDGRTTLGSWVDASSAFIQNHPYMTAFVLAVVATGFSLWYAYSNSTKDSGPVLAKDRR